MKTLDRARALTRYLSSKGFTYTATLWFGDLLCTFTKKVGNEVIILHCVIRSGTLIIYYYTDRPSSEYIYGNNFSAVDQIIKQSIPTQYFTSLEESLCCLV